MTVLVYGAYGYSGELAAERAVERGMTDLVLAGRNAEKTSEVADRLDREARVFDVEDAAANLDDIDVLLHCAGPFVETYEPMAQACLDTGTHYVDITGEIEVFEGLREMDGQAKEAGICLLPGAGFDVVPTDCLAGHLQKRLPDATELRLGFDPEGSISRGTLLSAIEQADEGGKIRRGGELKRVPAAHRSERIDFGRGKRNAVTIPWGDVSTAYHTTGIENIEVYTPMPAPVGAAMRFGSFAAPLLSMPMVKEPLKATVKATVTGPDDDTREEGACYVWGQVSDGEQTVTSRLTTPEGYTLTADAATEIARQIDEDDAFPTGYQTPCTAFSPEFVLDLDGVEGFFDE